MEQKGENQFSYNNNNGGNSGSNYSDYPNSDSDNDQGDYFVQSDFIDKMQAQFGEYLKNNQKYVELQKEHDLLRLQYDTLNENYKNETKNLNDEIEQLKKRNKEDQNLNESLKDQIDQLQTELNQRSDEIIALKNSLQNNEDDYKQKIDDSLEEQKNDYEDRLNQKDDEINNLTNEIETYKNEVDKLKQTILDLQNEKRDLKIEIEKNETQILEYKSTKELNEKTIISLRKTIEEMKQEKMNQDKQIESYEKQIKQYKETNSAQNNTIEMDKKQIQNLNDKLNTVHELLPEYSEYNELISKLKEKIEIAEALPIEIRKMKKTASKALKAARISASKMEQAEMQKKETEENAQMIAKQAEQVVAENKAIKEKYLFISQWKKNVRVIEDSNKEFVRRLNGINALLKETNVIIPLRTLIISTIIINRWKKLPGTTKEYCNDTRNWWWICGDLDREKKKNETIEIIDNLLNAKSKLLQQISDLEGEVKKCNDEIKENKKVISMKDKELKQVHSDKFDVELKVVTLQDEVDSKIDKETYKKLYDKYNVSQNDLKRLQKALKKTTEQIVYLEHELSIMRQKESVFISNKKQIERNENEFRQIIQNKDAQIHNLTMKLSSQRINKNEEEENKNDKISNYESKKEKEEEPVYIEQEDTRKVFHINSQNKKDNLFQKLSIWSRNLE